MLKLAILDKDPLMLELFSDMLENWKPDLFSDATKFKQIDYALYDLILIDHSIEPDGWESVYKDTKKASKAKYGIMSTYSQEYYKLEEPEKLTLTHKVIKDPRITGIFKKSDYKKIQDC